MIAHSKPTIGPEDLSAVAESLASGQLAQGAGVRRFEERIAAACGRRDAVATNSGTSALHLALLGLGIGPGDEVLVPSYTCVALLHAVRLVGATPRLADVDPQTYNLTAAEARRALTPATRAIIVPHMFGLPADVPALAALGIPIIEDCAQAIGATHRGRPVGGLGTVGIYSFYATKVLTTGEGGMLVADDPRLLDLARDARDYDGRPTFAPRFNYKMTEFQAALGLSQLERLPRFLARRRALAACYGERLAAAGVARPAVPPECGHIFYRYVVRVDDAARLAGGLERRGIEAKRPVFSPLHRYVGEDGFPHTDEAMRTALSLPIYPSLADADVETVVDALAYERAAARRWRRKEAPLRVTSYLPA